MQVVLCERKRLAVEGYKVKRRTQKEE